MSITDDNEHHGGHMHEATALNGTGETMHEEDGSSLLAHLMREVTALTAEYDQLRAEHADANKRKRSATERASVARKSKVGLKEKYNRACEQADKQAADADAEAKAAREAADEITPRLRDVRDKLRRREQQLATETSERTPRALKS